MNQSSGMRTEAVQRNAVLHIVPMAAFWVQLRARIPGVDLSGGIAAWALACFKMAMSAQA
jgi:hypothetical protein